MPKYKTFYGRNLFPVLLFLSLFIYTNQLYSQNCKVEIVPGYTGKGCVPLIVKLRAVNTDKSKTPVRWTWDFRDGTINNNPLIDSIVMHQYFYPSPDTIKYDYKPCVKITYSDGTQCQACLPSKITALGLPTSVIKLPVQTKQCLVGNNFCFSEASLVSQNGAPIVQYLWDFGDGEFDTVSKNPCHTYKASGVYTVRLAVKDTNGCIDFQEKLAAITVASEPQPRFTIGNYTRGCLPLTIKINNMSLKPGSKYIWNKGDGTTITTSSNEAVVTLVYDQMNPADHAIGKDSSQFFLSMTQIDSCFDMIAGSKTYISATWPDTSINPGDAKIVSVYRNDSVFITGDSLKCSGKELNFKINFLKSVNPGFYMYFDWDFNDGQTITQTTLINSKHIYKNAGIYNIKVKAYTARGCSTISQSFKVRVSGIKAHFSPSKVKTNTFSFSNNTKDTSGYNISKFYWNFGDTTALDSVNWASVQHTYKGSGPYNVSLKMIYGNGCTSIFDTTVSSSTGINETALNNFKINISPNPFTESTNIQYSLTEKANVKIQVYDVTGKLITSLADTKAQPGDYNLLIDAQKLNMRAGIYFVKIMISDKIADRKIIKVQ